MLKVLYVALVISFFAVSVAAQDATTADYAIRNIRSRFADGGAQTVIEFEVWNIGASATEQATASLKVISTGQEVATDIVPPLKAQEIVTVSLRFPTDLFPANTVESLRAAVGVDEVEASGSQNVQNNFAQISITFPPVQTPQATPEPAPNEAPAGDITDAAADFLSQFGVKLDLSNPVQIIVIISLCGIGLVLLLILFLLIRVIFQRPPDMGNWQPSYVNLLPLDPNSAAGRRQQWQTHAQNNVLPAYGQEGEYQVRKLATKADRTYLAGWRVDAIRLCQYDMYGRVTRSQMLAPRQAVNRLNGVLRRRASLDAAKASKRLRPVAKILINSFKKKWNERNIMLPIALDIRLKGKFGEVRIQFDLYQFRVGGWGLIDSWEPEMTVASKMIQEAYTYTVYGQRPSETTREFRSRLQDDLTQVLLELVAPPVSIATPMPSVPPPSQPQPPTNPHLNAVDI
jgi:hypothetical protein